MNQEQIIGHSYGSLFQPSRSERRYNRNWYCDCNCSKDAIWRHRLSVRCGANGKGVFEKVLLAFFTLLRILLWRWKNWSDHGSAQVPCLIKIYGLSQKSKAPKMPQAHWRRSPRRADRYWCEIWQSKTWSSSSSANSRCQYCIWFPRWYLWPKRRILKLDFPYTFGYCRTIDQEIHIWRKMTTPEVLAGIVKLIVARRHIL